MPKTLQGNSADKLHHSRSVAYSAELVLLNKHKISGGGVCLHCNPLRHWCRSVSDLYSGAKMSWVGSVWGPKYSHTF